ncbi:hypothetical protein DY000_02038500 [Brassica cretica]|uniref:Protein kinase domain-containing protein n=1 Tax=Brassica cretica TaxID=69181 RepID=A0ABQ7B8D9_BRACR|nr:hypothetical protein DY000_02038500 [Brassica cretica]
MSSETSAAGDGGGTSAGPAPAYDKQKEKARVSRTSLILWNAHQNDASAVRKLLEEDPSLDRWKNTPLADAQGGRKQIMIELLKSHGGLSYGQNGSHFEPKPVPPPIPKKCDWEIDPPELDFSNAMIGKGSFGEIVKAYWRGTPVAVKRILPSLSDDRLVM